MGLSSKGDRMALKPCRECGREVSTESSTCPQCGAPNPTKVPQRAEVTPPAPVQAGFLERAKGWLLTAAGWATALFLVMVAVGYLFSQQWLLVPATLLLAAAFWPRTPISARVRGPAIGVAMVVVVAVVATASVASRSEARNATNEAAARAEQEAATTAALEVEFAANREAIISDMEAAIRDGDLLAALQRGAPYQRLGDDQLDRLMLSTRTAQDETVRAAREAELVASARGIPARDLARNRAVYGELKELDPDNARYQERFDHYHGLITARQAEEQRVRAAQQAEVRSRLTRFGPLPEKSAWDGSYRIVTTYLEGVANDPSSIDIDACTKVYYTDLGWLVGCDYRGKNAFGGVVRQSNWFTILHGRVVLFEEASAHSPG